MADTYYCESSDIATMIGNMEVGQAKLNEWGTVGKEEIEIALSGVYLTPVQYAGTPGDIAISKLVLKRINATISAGRFLLSITAGGEHAELHTYGKYLVDQFRMMINEVLDGNPALAAEKVNTGSGSDLGSVPIAMFADSGSQVEAFTAFTSRPGADGMLLDPRRSPVFGYPKQAGG